MAVQIPPDHEQERRWLQTLLRGRIPFVTHMELEVTELDPDGIRLCCPLPPSVNDKGTAFGGALASAMILAGWSLPRLLLLRHRHDAELVIGRCELKFLEPVHGAYCAECHWPDPVAIEAFLGDFRTHGKGRLDLAVRIVAAGKVAATLEARYAALRPITDPAR